MIKNSVERLFIETALTNKLLLVFELSLVSIDCAWDR